MKVLIKIGEDMAGLPIQHLKINKITQVYNLHINKLENIKRHRKRVRKSSQILLKSQNRQLPSHNDPAISNKMNNLNQGKFILGKNLMYQNISCHIKR